MELADRQHETFAQLLAAGESQTKAALRAGYNPQSAPNIGSRLARKTEVFQRVVELQSLQNEQFALAGGIRVVDNRLFAINDRWDRLTRIIYERANSYRDCGEPGAKSGLLIRETRTLGSGDKAITTERYVLDTELLKMLLAHEQAAAEELQQRTRRTESYNATLKVNVSDRAQVQQAVRELPPDHRRAILDEAPEVAELLGEHTPGEGVQEPSGTPDA
jgi:phage terminase small subunit